MTVKKLPYLLVLGIVFPLAAVWAQDESATGRALTQADWIARFPVLALIVVFTLLVTFTAAFFAWRRLRQP